MKTEFTVTQKRALAVVTVIAILFGAYFLRGYFILIVMAAVGAYLFTPLFNWRLSVMRKDAERVVRTRTGRARALAAADARSMTPLKCGWPGAPRSAGMSTGATAVT